MLVSYIRRVKELFQLHIRSEARRDFQYGIRVLNTTRAMLISAIFLCMEILVLINTIVFHKDIFFINPEVYYRNMCLLLIPVTAIFLILFHLVQKELDKHQTASLILEITFTILILCWCAGISLIDIRHGGDALVYMIAVLVVAVTPIYHPMILLLIYFTVHTAFITIMLHNNSAAGDLFGSSLNSTTIIIISWAIAFMRYKNRGDDFLTKKKLQENAEELKRLNGKLEDANHKLEVLSMTDGLTGIYNRSAFERILDKEWKRCVKLQQYISLIMIDIDFFKAFNDNYGHQAGDVCLKHVAEVLTDCAESITNSVVRYGGEEFAIILPAVEEEDAGELAEKIRCSVEALNIPHDYSDVSSCVTISLGVHAIVPFEGESIEGFIRKTDKALYKAKKISRNRVVVA